MVIESKRRQPHRRGSRQQTAFLLPPLHFVLTTALLVLLVAAATPAARAQSGAPVPQQPGTGNPTPPPVRMPVHANTPTDVARVWMELNLVQDLPSSTLISDSTFRSRLNGVPTSRLILIKSIRERPEFQQLALEMRNRMREYVTFGTPEMLPDGRHARVPVVINEKNFNEWMLQDEVASQFIQQYVRALKDVSTGRVPTIETVRSLVLNDGNILKRKIEDSRQRYKDQPHILVVLEPSGWRVDVTTMEAQRSERLAAIAKEKEEKAKEREAAAQKLAAGESSDGNGSSSSSNTPPPVPHPSPAPAQSPEPAPASAP